MRRLFLLLGWNWKNSIFSMNSWLAVKDFTNYNYTYDSQKCLLSKNAQFYYWMKYFVHIFIYRY